MGEEKAFFLSEEGREHLLRWYRREGRCLPWREGRDPYQIWVIETLLQQTQISQARTYIERFFQRFPTLEKLAQADVESLLEIWQGLGYYQRAHNLHKAAQQLYRDGGWEAIWRYPSPLRYLEALPGVGPYTARAILSFSEREAYLPVDGNVMRVLSRLWGLPTRSRTVYQTHADALPLHWRQREVGYALMDLAQLICVPRSPKCLLCPLKKECIALSQGRPSAYPPVPPPRQKPIRPFLFILCTSREGVWLQKRPTRGLWGGLWCPPMQFLKECPSALPTFTHQLTHFQLWGYVEKKDIPPEETFLVPWEHLERTPLPAPLRRLLVEEAETYKAPSSLQTSQVESYRPAL
ncbi:MAG: A/G-specific adenine glycosylase [Bacteroidia bacterium]|nr:A/G-specific adenine glycosylase [Bacteroidia bacterium]MDW8014384.1 A/G-specific adenine glycosylase [Bacteroidia bacterium]